jgi:hypothetical protein
MLTPEQIAALDYWVRNEGRMTKLNSGAIVNDLIKEAIKKQEPLDDERIVYRGQKAYNNNSNPREIYPVSWFSTAKTEKAAAEFADADCCIFKIHVMPGMKLLDVHAILGSSNDRGAGAYSHEEEILVLGNGAFYKDRELKDLGFIDRDGDIEAFYGPRKSVTEYPAFTANELFNFLPKEEYNFINKNYILTTVKHRPVSNNVAKVVANRIKNLITPVNNTVSKPK